MDASSVLQKADLVAANGAAVVSTAIDLVVGLTRELILSGRSGTVYLSRPQAEVVRPLYWRPEVIERKGMEPIAEDERARISSVLGLEIVGSFICNQVQCDCGHAYGIYDFFEQAIREHGRETIVNVLSLKEAYVLQVNPRQSLVCPRCGNQLARIEGEPGGLEYEGDMYGCCYQDSCW